MKQRNSLSQIRFSVLTPPGRSAVAVVAVWGMPSLEWLETLFCPANPQRWKRINNSELLPLETAGTSNASLPIASARGDNLVFYGTWVTTGEDVLVLSFSDRIEVHCHGGVAAVASITDSLRFNGGEECQEQDAAEWLFGSPWQAALARCTARTTTERTAEFALAQFLMYDRLADQLCSDCQDHHSRFLTKIQQMLDFAEFGRHLTRPWSVVLCGPPNAGKSSLINALVGFERAIVHPLAGTTRDVVSQLAAVEGWPIELKDTAGLRHSDQTIEKRGIELSVDEIKQADLVLLVFDATEQLSTQVLDLISPSQVSLVVCNKMDLIHQPDSVALQSEVQRISHLLKPVICDHDSTALPLTEFVYTSALDQQNLTELINKMAQKLVPQLPPDNLLIPMEAWQVDRLQQIRESQSLDQTLLHLKHLFGDLNGGTNSRPTSSYSTALIKRE